MNSSVTSFFSRDVFLKRQARTRKQASPSTPCPSSSLKSKPLHIIPEEDEPRPSHSSSSRSPSPLHSPGLSAGGNQSLGVKAKRRHANVTVSDIRVARAALVHNDNDISEHNSSLLSAPRPAPRPPTAAGTKPVPSPDSFSLTFTDLSFKFPHPPIPTPSPVASFDNHRSGSVSPTPSMSTSSTPTSPESRSTGLPTTPSSSDDEFPSYYSSSLPSFNPRRASIKPLVITKLNASSTPEGLDSRISPSLIHAFKDSDEHFEVAPFSSESSGEFSSSDSEESDSEWYTRELSKILTLCSPTPPGSLQQSRPESVVTRSEGSPSPAPRLSSSGRGYPSAQLDPAFPRRKRSRTSIPKYPPPPVPPIPAHLRSPSTSSLCPVSPSPSTQSKSSTGSGSRSNELFVTPPPVGRPPPRSSIPADCVLVDESYAFSDDGASSFSLSLYEDSATPEVDSPTSFYSQASPTPSPFPSSFPSSPSFPSPAADTDDLEFDFPVDEIQFDMDLDSAMMLPLSLPTSPIDLEKDIAHGLEELRLNSLPEERAYGKPLPQQPTNEEMFSTGVDVFNSPLSSEQRILRSKWSSSTLNSVREEHARRSGGLTSAKLRAYFGGSPISTKGRMSRKTSGNVPATPMSPSRRFRHTRKESDIMVIGYGQGQLRRRGSVTPTVSDVGSDESASSSTSSGLRRKPIPVEMFLRTGA